MAKKPTAKAIAAKAGVRIEDAKAILNKNGAPADYSSAMVELVIGARRELMK